MATIEFNRLSGMHRVIFSLLFAVCSLFLVNTTSAMDLKEEKENQEFQSTENLIKSCEEALQNEEQFYESFCFGFFNGYLNGIRTGTLTAISKVEDSTVHSEILADLSSRFCYMHFNSERDFIVSFLNWSKQVLEHGDKTEFFAQLPTQNISAYVMNTKCN